MAIYIDENFLCHSAGGEGRRAVDVPFLEGKCEYFIEHYRYVPTGEVWTRGDGARFCGELLVPTVDFTALEAAQAMHDELHESENLSLELLADHEYRLCMMELGL